MQNVAEFGGVSCKSDIESCDDVDQSSRNSKGSSLIHVLEQAGYPDGTGECFSTEDCQCELSVVSVLVSEDTSFPVTGDCLNEVSFFLWSAKLHLR